MPWMEAHYIAGKVLEFGARRAASKEEERAAIQQSYDLNLEAEYAKVRGMREHDILMKSFFATQSTNKNWSGFAGEGNSVKAFLDSNRKQVVRDSSIISGGTNVQEASLKAKAEEVKKQGKAASNIGTLAAVASFATSMHSFHESGGFKSMGIFKDKSKKKSTYDG